MKSARTLFGRTVVGLSPPFALAVSVAVIGTAATLFLVLINCPFFYNPRLELATYAKQSISADSHIDHFMVRNFFYLDGPDFYYELDLTPADRRRLVQYFQANSKGWESAERADELVPSSWRDGKPQIIERYFLNDPTTLMLSLDANSNKAWLVIWNY